MYYTDFSVYAQNTTASSTREAKLDLDLSLRPSLSLSLLVYLCLIYLDLFVPIPSQLREFLNKKTIS